MGLGTLELADANGNFIFPDINLAVGSNTFTLQATDSVGNVSTSSLTVVREGDSQRGDPRRCLDQSGGTGDVRPLRAGRRCGRRPA